MIEIRLLSHERAMLEEKVSAEIGIRVGEDFRRGVGSRKRSGRKGSSELPGAT